MSKTEHIQLRVTPATKKELKKRIQKKGFANFTKAFGYATEKAFGINISDNTIETEQ